MLQNLNLENVITISIEEMESFEPKLLSAKKNRSTIEYYFTLSPVLPLYILNGKIVEHSVTYLDSDTYFFNSPRAIFDEISNASVSIVGHRFPRRLKHLEKYGKYNVGWITYANNGNARKCLEWYSNECLQWCYDHIDGERYADQKYLDSFEDIIEDVHEIKNIGCDLAPWNLDGCVISRRDGRVFVDDQLLVLYHFEGLWRMDGNLYIADFYRYKTRMTEDVKEYIYMPYLRDLAANIERIALCSFSSEMKSIRFSHLESSNSIRRFKRSLSKLKKRYYAMKYNSVIRT